MTTCPSYTQLPVTCGPCDSSGGGGGCLGECGVPINLENATLRMSRSYLRTAFGSFQMTWFNRYEQSGAAANPSRGLGTNWTSANFAFQMDQGDGTLGFLWDPGRGGKVDLFSKSGSEHTACYCSLDTLSETINSFFVAMPGGSVTTFDKTTGMITKQTTAGGQETDYTYDAGTDRITEMRRTYTDGGSTSVESRLFSYYTSGENQDELQYVTLRQASVASPSSGDWTNLTRVELEYYGSSETYGNLGDLKRITQQVLDGMTWEDDQIEYFRYYKDSAAGKGYQHGLQYNLSPQGYANMVGDSLNPETATAVQLAPYASGYYEYDGQRRAKTASITGGDTTYTVVYSENPHLSYYDYNHWLRKAVLTTPDGTTKTVYSNNIGQDLLVDLEDGSDRWISYTKYDAYARVIERVQPSAINMSGTPYDPAFDNLDVQIKSSDGLINVTEYYAPTDTDPAAAPGRVKQTSVKQGSSGTPIALGSLEYETIAVGSGPTATTVYPLTKRTVYQSDDGGGSNGAATIYTNTFHSGTTQLDKVVETLPSVSGQNGGTWSGTSRERHFDLQGRLTKSIDTDLVETTYAYDDMTGAMTQMVQDAAGTPRTTSYESDDWGRTTQVLGPVHNVNGTSTIQTASWTVYKDEENAVWSGRGYYDGTDYTLINPVSIVARDKNGRPVDEVQAKRGSGVEDSGALSGSDAFAQSSWTRWTHHEYGDDGRLAATRVYHLIPGSGAGASGTNYDETTYAYDNMGRRFKTTTPAGTISKTFYDARNLVTETQVGTVDGGGSDNMRTVSENQYDGGNDGGDGNLTKVTSPVSATSADDRVMEYEYDWRDRRIATIAVESGTVEFRTQMTLDNLGRALTVEEKRVVSGSPTPIAKSETFYDNRGRVFRSKRYEVDDLGSTGNALTDNTWYDGEGRVLQSLPAGSQAFTKNEYDALGRATASYMGYYSGSGGESPDSVANDVIFSESQTAYDPAGNVTMTTGKERWHDATGNGSLNGPSGSQPKSRDSYMAYWYDGIGRQVAMANYGTNDNAGPPSRPAATPAADDSEIDVWLVSTTEYDPSGPVKIQAEPTEADPFEIQTLTEYDNAGRVTSVTRNYGSTPTETTDTTYTSDGQVATLVAVNATTGNQTTEYTYGVTLSNSEIASNDLLREVEYPDNGVVLYEYNRQGQRTKLTDQNGSVHDYEYDKLGRQTLDKVDAGTGVDESVLRIEWSYDNRRRLAHVTSYDADTGGSVTSDIEYDYNDFSQLKTEYQQHGGTTTGSSPKVAYTYAEGADNSSRRETCTYPHGEVLTYEYGSATPGDKLSRVEALDWHGTDVASYEYLGMNQVVIQKYVQPSPDVEYNLTTGGTSTNPYAGLDMFGRIINLMWKQDTTDLVDLKYGYDLAGNRTYRRDEVARSNSAGFDELYGYDDLDRLTSMNRGTLNGDNDAITGTTLTQGWTLDQTGNWSGFNQSNATPAYQTTRAHNTTNEITGITTTSGSPSWDTPPDYDDNGNMTEFVQPDSLGDSYTATWDAWNRLVKLVDGSDTVAEYQYDGLNRRVLKKVYVGGSLDHTRHAYFSDQWQVLEERVDASTSADRQFVWGLRYVDDLVLRDRTSERIYALGDALFNVVAITDDTGAVEERFAYQPYGQSAALNPDFTAYSGTNYGWVYRFTGRELDLESGLQINRMRYLHLQLGTWLSRDQLQYRGNLNLYEYTNSNAVNSSDPSGNITVQVVSNAAASMSRTCEEHNKKLGLYAWSFILDKPAPCKGYIVQKVSLKKQLTSCADCCNLNDAKLQEAEFWEAWPVNEGDTLWVGQQPFNDLLGEPQPSPVGYTDVNVLGEVSEGCGKIVADGEIRFYCEEVTGDLGFPNLGLNYPGFPSIPTAPNWFPGTGSPPAGILSYSVVEPDFWKNAKAIETATRRGEQAWRCCGDGDSKVVFGATPSR